VLASTVRVISTTRGHRRTRDALDNTYGAGIRLSPVSDPPGCNLGDLMLLFEALAVHY